MEAKGRAGRLPVILRAHMICVCHLVEARRQSLAVIGYALWRRRGSHSDDDCIRDLLAMNSDCHNKNVCHNRPLTIICPLFQNSGVDIARSEIPQRSKLSFGRHLSMKIHALYYQYPNHLRKSDCNPRSTIFHRTVNGAKARMQASS
jgi:hypothetical protein